MKCTANLNRAQNVKPRLQPAIRWTLHHPVDKEIHRESVRSAAYGEGRFDRPQRERSPPRPSMIQPPPLRVTRPSTEACTYNVSASSPARSCHRRWPVCRTPRSQQPSRLGQRKRRSSHAF